ncbi:MAG: phage holin, LLH family [Liquorilactobacillus ghanensis]|uniref:oxidoreductase n=1 Tax=Liquorilactobacillus ghanensis TaxID=399370 RepID=UPI0039E9E05C
MNTQNIAEIVVAIVVAIIGAVTPYLAKFIKSNKTAQTLVEVLPSLAKDAVIAMQKLGVTQYLEGELKKSKAAALVKSALDKLGFKDADADAIENAIESAYAELVKDGTLTVYPQLTKEQADAQANAAKLAAAQKQLTDAQATVAKLSTTTVASAQPAAQTTTPAK